MTAGAMNMIRQMILTIVCLLCLSSLGNQAVKSDPYTPNPMNQFEHEFEWLNGNVKANPFGLK
jgi:ABC-type antimicrobial peptide transport system permease subunit